LCETYFILKRGSTVGGGRGGGGGGSWAEKIYDKKCFAAARGLFSSFFRKLTLLNKRFRLCEESNTFPPNIVIFLAKI
jgi:hypothetical protein